MGARRVWAPDYLTICKLLKQVSVVSLRLLAHSSLSSYPGADQAIGPFVFSSAHGSRARPGGDPTARRAEAFQHEQWSGWYCKLT